MRALRMVALVVVLAPCAATARAGLYNTAEPRWNLGGDLPPSSPQRFREFQRDTLIPLRQIGSQEFQSPLHRQYTLIAALAGANPSSRLTIEQQIDLGASLIRLGRPRDAVAVLTQAYRREPDNFLVSANLATAEQLDGQLIRAQDYLADALRLWPEQWSELPEARRKRLESYGILEPDYIWYRRVEPYHLNLLRLRAREPKSKDDLPEAPDALFTGPDQKPVRFVGESGKFEAGKIAAAEKAKLPPNAVEIVQQLLVWLPHDMRLYWLLGELFNAEGNVEAARAIFEEIAVKWNPPPDKRKAFGFRQNPTYPTLFKEHLDALRAYQVPLTFDADTDETKPAADPPAPGVDWRALAIGFGAGILVALFGYWQVRELRRRRLARSPVKTAGG